MIETSAYLPYDYQKFVPGVKVAYLSDGIEPHGTIDGPPVFNGFRRKWQVPIKESWIMKNCSRLQILPEESKK